LRKNLESHMEIFGERKEGDRKNHECQTDSFTKWYGDLSNFWLPRFNTITAFCANLLWMLLSPKSVAAWETSGIVIYLL